MSVVAPFVYRVFYDFPRLILVRVGESLLHLQCLFDEELDDYPAEYTVYLLRDDFEPPDDWGVIAQHSIRELGRLPVREVRFDETRRKTIETKSLREFLTRHVTV